MDLPPLPQARRHALRRMAARVAAREVAPAALASDDWWETETGTPEEEALVALLPSCGCCAGYSIGADVRTWEVEVRAAALALARATPPPAGC
ncbi:hypothetical protein [Streptomyces lonarensis]|uniref:hypothetical protein n=1 Tax=Streptomyces lonarensis TaxID=700599 RepID=UPI001ADD70AE|nr:hypothetical protein [Streptomyces lonarensis]